jgi:hypothetical protein
MKEAVEYSVNVMAAHHMWGTWPVYVCIYVCMYVCMYVHIY